MGSIIIWLTGVSAAGKTTVAKKIQEVVSGKNVFRKHFRECIVLDADDVRVLWPDLGLSEKDRKENVTRIAHLASTVVNSLKSSLVIIACIAPYRENRWAAIHVLSQHVPCYEVYLHTSLRERIKRDPKGLYAKAINGEISDLTGYNGEYEEPLLPDFSFDTNKWTPTQIATKILKGIK